MLTDNEFISVTKNLKGELIFEINPEKVSLKNLVKAVLSIMLRLLIPIFSLFDALAKKKKLVISSIGLGIGLGISVLVTQKPDTLQAFPQFSEINSSSIRVSRIVISSIDLSVLVISGDVRDYFDNVNLNQLVHDDRSAGLGDHQPVVVADVGWQNNLGNLEQVKIGDKIDVVGSNDAEYRYRVTQIISIKAEYLPNVIGSQTESIILYKPQNLLRTQLYVLVAKPIK